MKKVEKKYIARAAAIMTAFSVAAMPVTSFLVSAVVTVISVKTIFIISGVLAFLVTALMSRKAYLLSDDEPASAISCEESVETDVEVNSIEEAI